MKCYIIVKTGYEYNDEYHYIPEGSEIESVHEVFLDREKAEKVAQKHTIEDTPWDYIFEYISEDRYGDHDNITESIINMPGVSEAIDSYGRCYGIQFDDSVTDETKLQILDMIEYRAYYVVESEIEDIPINVCNQPHKSPFESKLEKNTCRKI